ncbi:MAG: 7-cyano-7-deazaguanine synthase QueC [Proteobacteria bacterium]|nr:7-cyano-7-deazaguanine synthase QueC [Pseudomonadota bacterium]
MTSALVLLSGGLDSATTLAMARAEGFECYAISFAYGQRHRVELDAAEMIARKFAVLEHRIVPIDLSAFGGSALTDNAIDIPEASEVSGDTIPITYVPARNTVFLSLALAWSEVLGVRDIFMGVNAVDYSGYPDCRPEFILAFETMANLATKAGVEGDRFTIHTPLIDMRKADIIQRGLALGVDYRQTVSCYQPNDQGEACGRCASCRLRREGFTQSGVADPTRYAPT